MRLWKWRSPISLAASLLWNLSETLHFPCPFAPTVFGLMIGAKPRNAPAPDAREGDRR